MVDVSKCSGQKDTNGKYQLPAECDGTRQEPDFSGAVITTAPAPKKTGEVPAWAKHLEQKNPQKAPKH